MNKTTYAKGFTLAELLIVVAIIAALVSIAIPVFNRQLEQSREAADAANIRSAYAEAIVQIIENPQDPLEFPQVTLRQKQNQWQNDEAKESLDSLRKEASATDKFELAVTVDLNDVTSGGSVALTFKPGSGSENPSLTIASVTPTKSVQSGDDGE